MTFASRDQARRGEHQQGRDTAEYDLPYPRHGLSYRIEAMWPRQDALPDVQRAGVPYKDADGRQADFHSPRMTFGTMLAKSGAAPRTAMEPMRHTDLRLMMNVYTDPSILNTARAVEGLPDLTPEPEAAAALRTGTDDRPVAPEPTPKVWPKSTEQADSGGHTIAHSDKSIGPGASENASGDSVMVEAVGIEPTSGCPRTGASTRVVDRLGLGPRGSGRQDPQEPSRDWFSPTSLPANWSASPCRDVRTEPTGEPGRTWLPNP